MSELERYRARQAEEERERKHWRRFMEMCDEQAERVRNADSSFSPWLFLAVVLLLLASFLYTAYGTYRSLQNYRPAVAPPAATPAQGQPPQNSKSKRRANKRAVTPATERN